jgi:hypothetical protein
MRTLRHMQTTAELREVAATQEQGVKVRPSRNGRNLSTYYDDVQRARRQRSNRYKSHR